MVRAGTTGCVSRGGADERAVRGTAAASIQHGRWPAKAEARGSRASRTCGVAAAAQALPMVLFDARGQREHAPRAPGRARLLAGLLSSQKRGLERQRALSAEIVDRERAGKAADLLYHGPRQGHGGDGGGGDAFAFTNR